MVTIAVQGAVLVAVAIPFGLRPVVGRRRASRRACVCLLAIGISAASYAMGLILKDEDAFAPFIQGVSLPLLLLSGVLLPMSLAPAWLQHASKVNPLTYVVDGTRSLFRGDFGDGDVLLGAGIAIALSALLAWWGTRVFQRQSACEPGSVAAETADSRGRRGRRAAGAEVALGRAERRHEREVGAHDPHAAGVVGRQPPAHRRVREDLGREGADEAPARLSTRATSANVSRGW